MSQSAWELFKASVNFSDLISQVASHNQQLMKHDLCFKDIDRQLAATLSQVEKINNRLNKLEHEKYQKQDAADDQTAFQTNAKTEKNFQYHNNLLWIKGEKHPYCTRCHDADKKWIHLRYMATSGFSSTPQYFCNVCKFYAAASEPPRWRKKKE